jgi:hypothetical protein
MADNRSSRDDIVANIASAEIKAVADVIMTHFADLRHPEEGTFLEVAEEILLELHQLRR